MTAASISYRETLPAAADYAALFESTGWNRNYALTAEQLHQAIQASWYLVAAYDGERLVGSGRVLSDGVQHALIVDMIVLPDYQGQGIGSALLRRLLERCAAHGIRDVQLFCARDKSGFYEKFGFAPRPAAAPGMQLQRESR